MAFSELFVKVVFKGAQPLSDEVTDATAPFNAETSKMSIATQPVKFVAVADMINVVPLGSMFSFMYVCSSFELLEL